MAPGRREAVRGWAGALVRPRLNALLDVGRDRAMTLVVAPAGYGKTVLLAEWVRTLDAPVVWVSLGEPENDPGRLVHSFTGAVMAGLDDRIEPISERLDFTTPGSAPQLIEEWTQQLAGAGEFHLVLDDLHVITDPAATRTVQRLIEAVPSNANLCIASRHDPPLGVARLRMEGRISEIRQADLALTLGELTSMLDSEALEMSPDSLIAFHGRTEGWFAAVRLALISIRQSGDPEGLVRELSGTNRIIAEYLLEEVLAEMDPARQQFLLRTSILEEVSSAIGEFLTGRVDGQSILEDLASAGEFTTPTGEPGWFRYHGLVRDQLRARLRETDPELFLAVHRRAAAWHLRHGDPVMAINHSIAAREIDQAADWLGDAAMALTRRGQAATVVELSGRLLKHTSEPGLLLIMTRMSALYDAGADPDEIDRLMVLLEGMLAEAGIDGAPQPFVHGGDPRMFSDRSALPWLRGLRARANGDLAGLLALDRPEDLPSPSGRVEAFIAEGLLWSDRFDQAAPLLETFREHAQHDQFVPSIVHELGMRTYALIGRGRFAEAELLNAEASTLIDRFGLDRLIHTLYAQIATGWLLWEQGDLQGSESSLVASQEFAERSGDVPFSVQHALVRSRTRWSLGDADGAHDLLDQARMATGRVLTGHFDDRINLARAIFHLLAGEPGLAAYVIPNWRERLASARELPHARIVLSRIAVATGETAILDGAPIDDGSGTALHRIEASKSSALSALAAGDLGSATAALASAMRAAMGVGALQRVIDEECVFAPIFPDAAEAAGFASSGVDSAHLGNSQPHVRWPVWFVENLTDRELEVLEQLPTSLTYPEIADLLYVSANTVKTHAKAIFRKLSVSRRTDAVNRARGFGLIPD